MGISRKRSGPVPIYGERWQELAKDSNRLPEAAREYRSTPEGRTCSLVDAHRKIKEFHRNHIKTFGGR